MSRGKTRKENVFFPCRVGNVIDNPQLQTKITSAIYSGRLTELMMAGGLPSSFGEVITVVYYSGKPHKGFGFDHSTTKTVDAFHDLLIKSDIKVPEKSSYTIMIYDEDAKMDFVLANRYLDIVCPWLNLLPTKKIVKLTVIENVRSEAQSSVQLGKRKFCVFKLVSGLRHLY